MDVKESGCDNWIHPAQDRVQWYSCEHGNEPSGSTEHKEFCDCLRDELLKKDSTPWSE